MNESNQQHPPFIQISGTDRTAVYGLTASGEVWRWFYDQTWQRLGEVDESEEAGYIPTPAPRGLPLQSNVRVD